MPCPTADCGCTFSPEQFSGGFNQEPMGKCLCGHPTYLHTRETLQGKSSEYYLVKAKIRSCKNYKGYRCAIYDCAQKCQAYYYADVTSSEKSSSSSALSLTAIPQFPNDSFYFDNNDLMIRLLFKNENNGLQFQNALTVFQQSHTAARSIIEFDRDLYCMNILPSINLSRVLLTDYITKDSDSPECLTLADLISVRTEATDIDNPEKQMQMLEDKSLLGLYLGFYRCYIAPKAYYPEFRDDEDNIIYASWDFHNYYDALHLTNPTPHKCPELAISFNSYEGPLRMDVDQLGQVSRYKVWVILELLRIL